MNFRPRTHEEPEINLIPFIDVLLVILIFLMLTTTYSKFTELQLTLPVADADQQRDRPKEVIVAVAADGRYAVNKAGVEGKSVDAVAQALRTAAPSAGQGAVVIIETKKQQLTAIVNAYQALGGGLYQHSCYPEAVVPSGPLPTDSALEEAPTIAPGGSDKSVPVEAPPAPADNPAPPAPVLPPSTSGDEQQ